MAIPVAYQATVIFLEDGKRMMTTMSISFESFMRSTPCGLSGERAKAEYWARRMVSRPIVEVRPLGWKMSDGEMVH